MQLSCPLPQLDFDVITLGHGAGGLLTNQLLESGVFDLLKNPLLDTRHDGAVFDLPGRIAFSTDSYVISPVFFPGGNIGELAVNGTVNDLAMCGAAARYLSLAFILEEGLSMQDFWDILVKLAVFNFFLDNFDSFYILSTICFSYYLSGMFRNFRRFACVHCFSTATSS